MGGTRGHSGAGDSVGTPLAPVSPSHRARGWHSPLSPGWAVPWVLCWRHPGSCSPPAPRASHGSHAGRGSTAQDRELQRAAGRAPAEITPLIVLLQELRDKRDLQDLPAIQIEFLILAAGDEAGLSPGSARRGAGGRHGASRPPGDSSPVLRRKRSKKDHHQEPRGGRQPCAGGARPPPPQIPAAAC